MNQETSAGLLQVSSEETSRPRDRMYLWAVDRIHILQDYASRHCQVPNCGGKDDEGEPIPCSGSSCGERRIHADHRRELRAMRDLKALIEALELKELQAKAAADKKGKGK